jgi:hypothetical protein
LECAVVVILGPAADAHRDDLISQCDNVHGYTVLDEQRNYTASTLGDADASPHASRNPGRRDPRPGRPRRFARRPAGRPETPPGQAANARAPQTPAPQTPASVPAPAE